MARTRKAGSGDNYRSYWKAREQAVNQKGVPMPGTGGHHSYHKRHAKRNPTGATFHAPGEWGGDGRKQEEHQTGLAQRAKFDAINEGLAEVHEAEFSAFQTAQIITEAEWADWADWDDWQNCWDDGPEALDWDYDDREAETWDGW